MTARNSKKQKTSIERNELKRIIAISIIGILSGVILATQAGLDLKESIFESSYDDNPESISASTEGKNLEFVHHLKPEDNSELAISTTGNIIIETEIDLDQIREKYDKDQILIGVTVEDQKMNALIAAGLDRLSRHELEGSENYEHLIQLSQLEPEAADILKTENSKKFLLSTNIAYEHNDRVEIIESHKTSFNLKIRE